MTYKLYYLFLGLREVVHFCCRLALNKPLMVGQDKKINLVFKLTTKVGKYYIVYPVMLDSPMIATVKEYFLVLTNHKKKKTKNGFYSYNFDVMNYA